MSEYKKVKLLGKGAFGKVWHVQHLATRKEYAAKFIALADVDEDVIMKEIKSLQEYKHPSIVPYVTHFKDGKKQKIAIIMDLCPGNPRSHNSQEETCRK